ncbi:MAG: RNA-binding domain-containing protein [Thermoplasmatota archaeon]
MYPEHIDVEVEIRTLIYPTEDLDKVKTCLSKVFPEAEWKVKEKEIVGESNSLERFAEIIEEMRIRDTVRSYLEAHTKENRCSFTLSKQASCNGKVNLSDEDQPLGGIDITMKSDQIDKFIKKIMEI